MGVVEGLKLLRTACFVEKRAHLRILIFSKTLRHLDLTCVCDVTNTHLKHMYEHIGLDSYAYIRRPHDEVFMSASMCDSCGLKDSVAILY